MLLLADEAKGIAGALAIVRFLAIPLYGVTDSGPSTFIGVSEFLVAVPLLVCYIPERRAPGSIPWRRCGTSESIMWLVNCNERVEKP